MVEERWAQRTVKRVGEVQSVKGFIGMSKRQSFVERMQRFGGGGSLGYSIAGICGAGKLGANLPSGVVCFSDMMEP